LGSQIQKVFGIDVLALGGRIRQQVDRRYRSLLIVEWLAL
jgi:hypothetical protein